MKNQVLSIDQMNYLKELGIDTSNASMCWVKEGSIGSELKLFSIDNVKSPSLEKEETFTLMDLLRLLPNEIDLAVEEHNCYISCYLMLSLIDNAVYYEYEDWDKCGKAKVYWSDSLLNSAYMMLCDLAENGYLRLKDNN